LRVSSSERVLEKEAEGLEKGGALGLRADRKEHLEVEEGGGVGAAVDLAELGEAGVDDKGGEGVSKVFAHIEVPEVVGCKGLGVAEGHQNGDDQVKGKRVLEEGGGIQVFQGGRLDVKG